jgi:hypothetical protein
MPQMQIKTKTKGIVEIQTSFQGSVFDAAKSAKQILMAESFLLCAEESGKYQLHVLSQRRQMH